MENQIVSLNKVEKRFGEVSGIKGCHLRCEQRGSIRLLSVLTGQANLLRSGFLLGMLKKSGGEATIFW